MLPGEPRPSFRRAAPSEVVPEKLKFWEVLPQLPRLNSQAVQNGFFHSLPIPSLHGPANALLHFLSVRSAGTEGLGIAGKLFK